MVAAAPIAGCADEADDATGTSRPAAGPATPADASSTTADPGTASTLDASPDATDAPDTTDATETTETTEMRETTTSIVATDDGVRPVVTFDDPSSVSGWSNVDDTVMGGVSASTSAWEDGQLVFAGDLSLENNGGFTSVRSPEDTAIGADLGAATSLVVDATGDGRTYVLQLRTADDSLYIARFATVAGERQTYALALDSFEPVTRFLEPSPGSPPLDAASVVQLAIYLLDKQEGTFRLAVSGLGAQ